MLCPRVSRYKSYRDFAIGEIDREIRALGDRDYCGASNTRWFALT